MTTGVFDLMKVAGGDLAPCSHEMFKGGKYVCLISGGSARLIDRFVKEVAEYSDQPVDWHYMGGRARVVTIGDTAKVWDAICCLHLHIQDAM